MKKLLALAFLLISAPAWTQNPTCPTRPVGSTGNACASVGFVAQGSAVVPTPGTLNQGFNILQTGPATGTTVGPTSFNIIDSTYTSTTTGSSDPFFDHGAWQTWVAALRVNLTVGSNNLGGEPYGAGFFQARNTTNSTSSSDLIGVAGEAFSNATTNMILYGAVGAAIIDAGANVPIIVGLFSETDIVNGGVTAQRRGLTIANQGTATATTAMDTAINVGSQFLTGSFKKFIVFYSGGGAQPLQLTADIFWADSALTVANVFNLPNMTVTGNIFNFPNITITGAGIVNSGGGSLDPNTGAFIQASKSGGGYASLIAQVNGAAAFNGLHVSNSTGSGNSIFVAVPEPSSVTSIFGIANGNWAEIVSVGASNLGLLIGTLTAKPTVFGMNNVEVMRIDNNLLTLKKQAFASLAACATGTEGAMGAVTDSSTNTWGATITGGGANHVLGYCDGTNWTVAGK